MRLLIPIFWAVVIIVGFSIAVNVTKIMHDVEDIKRIVKKTEKETNNG